jgi:hypothetical protein
MAEVLLLISKILPEFTHLKVKCTLCQNTENLRTRDREFRHPRDLESALRAAGVECDEARAPFQVFETGLPTFIPVSLDIVRKLGMLEQ